MSGIAIRPATGKSDGQTTTATTTAYNEPPQNNQTMCRNILIHGYCKFADKGCAFRHDSQRPSLPESPAKVNIKKKLNADSPSFTPSFGVKSPSKSPNTSAIPFVPKLLQQENKQPSMYNPESVFSPQNSLGSASSFLGGGSHAIGGLSDGISPQPALVQDFSGMSLDHMGQHHMHPGGLPPPPPPPQSMDQMHGAGRNMIFNQHSAYPLNYHLYAPAPERSRLHLEPHQRAVEDLFVSNKVREELQRKNEARLQQFPAPNLPDQVHVYHSLVPLDMQPEGNPRVFGYPSWTYKAISNADGKVYCLRRIEGFKLTNERAMRVQNMWTRVDNPAIVRFHSAFTTRAFGDNSLITVYDYHPLATTIYDVQFGKSGLGYYNNNSPYSESMIWSFISQLLSALRTIHNAKLAAGVVDPTKIIQTGQGRLRLNCVGVHDLMQFDESVTKEDQEKKLVESQQEDIHSLGLLILCLACNSSQAHQDIAKSLDFVSISYSEELVSFLKSVLSTEITPSAEDLIKNHALRFLDVMNAAVNNSDSMEQELSRELENGRLVRLLFKMNFINERPEYEIDPAWSESGERYIIKLFRDYVFHQVDEYKKPVVDIGHVLTCLNKLDAGVDESIMLISRDEQNCLLVTYKELKVCIESAFRQLNRN